MRFGFSDREKVNYITHVYRGRRSIARRFTSLLIRIYERGVEGLQGSAALHPKDNCFPRRCTGDVYV